jgi:hypothetical protein
LQSFTEEEENGEDSAVLVNRGILVLSINI